MQPFVGVKKEIRLGSLACLGGGTTMKTYLGLAIVMALLVLESDPQATESTSIQ